ncbi:MAG: FAD-binding oxidoreductase [Hyphomonadaceae bacterium]|nr:FAD-binding oxidoreductase [Hyphomonadaceae bacterium]
MTPVRLRAAQRRFAAILGADRVFFDELDRETYSDQFAISPDSHVPIGAVAPESVEEIRAIVAVANAYKLPLWPISRGKNLGYGGSAPVLSGSVVLDLSRMKKIEVDRENGVVLVEPGVSFYDLHDYLQTNDIPLWLSVPGNSWGSVAGNALDRGVGYTTYGDHTSKICGLEVVLPDGDLVRTGMGAMANAPTWQLYRYGYGPAWDQLFVQSNFGIVTKLGLWLMPRPESMMGLELNFDKPEDLEWAVDILAGLRREGLLQQAPSIGNWLRAAAVLTKREDWHDQPGALPDSVIAAIRRKFQLGWWGTSVRVYGRESVNRAAISAIKSAFKGHRLMSMERTHWVDGEPLERSAWVGAPITFPMQNVGWHGGRGGHIGFSPVLPANGRLAMEQFRQTYARYKEFGMDYQASFAMGERHLTNVNAILFNQDDPAMMARIHPFFRTLVADAKARGYAEYRAHIEHMDLVAETYDFNNHALRRLNERVKDALDPNGVIAPGKSGIWPARLRTRRRR